jgi:hypothetical protein
MPSGSGSGGLIQALPVTLAQGGTVSTTAAAALVALSAAAAGSHVLKLGSASGNVSFTATSQTKLFGTTLDVTQTVPVGVLALALCQLYTIGPNAGTLELGIAIDGTWQAATAAGGASSVNQSTTLIAVFVGDGSSHTFSPQGFVSGGSATLANSGSLIPLHVVLFVSAT